MNCVTMLWVALMFVPLAAVVASKIFATKYHIDDLSNGLRLITVPTDYPNLVALYIVVQAGSRNEVEPGKSGFAHLFEHLMFRGTEQFSPEMYDQILKNAGADHNAYTADDRTAYHIVFSKEDLDQILMLEADRFKNLKVPIDDFKTETKAVLGEYNKNASNPIAKLLEVVRDTAFHCHTYKHTTMGFVQDVENMPNMYDYSQEFFRRYYRPENTIIILAGDVEHAKALASVKEYWEGWTRGSHLTPNVTAEPPQTEELTAHVKWETPTLPWVLVAYKGPAFSDTEKDMPSMDLIGNLGFAESSPLYQQLVVREQKVDTLGAIFEDHLDPYLVMVLARVKNADDVDYVKNEIVKVFDSFRTEKVPEELLEEVKSHLRYEFALSLDNSQAIAARLAPYVALTRDPETINRLYEVYAAVTPDDIQQMANKYFHAGRRTVATLSYGE
ncbi:MAG TPA: pitrilysin family protein [Blastocatellia bacterium]|nr:pitrilysin family protein [Blastocatellia bacterium]